MTRRSLSPSSISLFAQLLLTFVALIAATAVGLTIAGYRTSLENLRASARDNAYTAAETRDEMLAQLLAFRERRAQGLLESAESLCAEPAGRNRLAWADTCVRTLVSEFQRTEHAAGAVLSYRGGILAEAGRRVTPVRPDGGSWAVVVRGPDRIDYVMTALHGDTTLALEFDSGDVLPLFRDDYGVGTSGEVFLIDSTGRTLTPLRHDASGLTLSESAARCRSEGPDNVVDLDYRGARVIRAFRPVDSLPGACVVAHIGFDEALAGAASLRATLTVQGVTFVLAGVLLSLAAARRIAAPVQRLAECARGLQAGHFDQRVPIAGPSEVRALGRAVAAMANDLAELVAQEQSARREAEAANRSKDQFLAMLSHELRTPLTAVLGWAHTLRTGPFDPDRVHRAASAIERSAEAQRRLIEDLLDVTGIAAGRVRMVPAPTSLASVVEAALEAVRPRAEEKGVRLECAIDDRPLTVYGDAQRLQQVVWNLAWNAVKFTPAGGRVDIRTRAMGGLAELIVSDTGIGIEPAFLQHVFEWFRRADRDARTGDEGLGLGLALVRQLVELHGGNVRAESAGRDCGSTFVVTLPLHHEGSAVAPAADASRAAPTPDRLASIRILVVDDDPGSREAVRVLLEQVGAHVDTAASAAEARRHLRTSATDVLISDIAMAQESGYTLMETLRAEGLTLPGIALTGYARREDADKAYAAGFDVHLPKPVDPDVLVSVLAAVTKHDAA